MNQFQYSRPLEIEAAIKANANNEKAYFLAGGTNLVDLMKMQLLEPDRIIDLNKLPLKQIEKTEKGMQIGALVSNAQLADHEEISSNYPLLSQAINAGASPQLRNMATTGGNLMQRTRCSYFFDLTMPCNKRKPGSGCGAINGYNRMHAIFGASDKCIAVNPSDMNVALAALEGVIRVKSEKGLRLINISDFHRLPGDHPEIDTVLKKGELILGIELPLSASRFSRHAHYLKIRDRSSYAFALVSVAAALHIEHDQIAEARLAMGGVAHKPWRLHAAEAYLKGKKVSEEVFQQAAEIAMRGATAYSYNQFKLKLAPNAIVQSLKEAAGLTENKG